MSSRPPAAEERHSPSPARRGNRAREGGLYTAAYVVALCGASGLLATLPQLRWKDRIAENRNFKRTRAVVDAFGLAPGEPRAAIREAFNAHVEVRQMGTMEVFEAREGGRLLGYAMEIGGRGWDGPFKGLLAIDPWRNRIIAVTIYEQLEAEGREGPAISREWLDRFRGLPLVTNGKPGIIISWQAEGPDAVSGPTPVLRQMAKIISAALERFFAKALRLEVLDLGLGPDAVTRATPIYPPGLRKPPHMRREEKRPAFMVPSGTRNLALGKPVASSTKEEPIIGELSQVTDGVKKSRELDFVELDPGLQWVQIDLETRARVYAIVIWHYYKDPVIYNDVIVRVSDDPGFGPRVVTLFNNDHDGSAGLGTGRDAAYFARWWGEIVDARGGDRRGTPARYVRVCTRGGARGEDTRFVEIAVYGLAESSPQPVAP